ncbi:hypothetical protein ABBQ32_002331 [Trebouxia sp. C0010 RCD-2024]
MCIQLRIMLHQVSRQQSPGEALLQRNVCCIHTANRKAARNDSDLTSTCPPGPGGLPTGVPPVPVAAAARNSGVAMYVSPLDILPSRHGKMPGTVG